MGDKYVVSQAGAVGPDARARDMTFNQTNQTLSDPPATVDLQSLRQELKLLLLALKNEASEPEHYVAISEVAYAEIAAGEGNGENVVEHLRKAGRWAISVATNIGAAVAANVITKAIEM